MKSANIGLDWQKVREGHWRVEDDRVFARVRTGPFGSPLARRFWPRVVIDGKTLVRSPIDSGDTEGETNDLGFRSRVEAMQFCEATVAARVTSPAPRASAVMV